MNDDLQSMWNEINAEHFGGELNPVAEIDWAPISGEDGLDAFGAYFPYSNCIVIDERFKFDADMIRAGDEKETARLEVAFRLVLHEMIHQSLYQKMAPKPGGHSQSFVEEATRIAEKLDIQPPTEKDAFCWPDLLTILASYSI